jgi:hypothetical protein
MRDPEVTYESPEEAALAGWTATPSAGAHVISVEVIDDRAQVVIGTGGDPDGDHDYVYCLRRNGRWREVISGSGPSEGWSDPTVLEWD